MVTSEGLLDLLKYGEHLMLECKKAENELPRSIWESYSAFANTLGGTILLGIDENLKENVFEKRFTISGVGNPQVRLKEFWDTINNTQKVVFCKPFLAKVAKYFWRKLHLHFGESCSGQSRAFVNRNRPLQTLVNVYIT